MQTTRTVLSSCCADKRDVTFIDAFARRFGCSPVDAQKIVDAISENVVRILTSGMGVRFGVLGGVYPREWFKRIDGTKEFMRRLSLVFEMSTTLRGKLKKDLEDETQQIPTSVLRKIAIDERVSRFNKPRRGARK